VVGPLATVREPHSWDLCVLHAGRITAPRGWELMRHAGPLPEGNPDEDDLIALAEAVREGRNDALASGMVPTVSGFSDPSAGHGAAPGGGWVAGPARGSKTAGRRRGHLRVLPDPVD
jgi:Protein of unknown function (DUF3499)